jgi:hypothetical protein
MADLVGDETFAPLAQFATQLATTTGPLLVDATEAQQVGHALGALLAAHRDLFDECWQYYWRYYALLAATGQPHPDEVV